MGEVDDDAQKVLDAMDVAQQPARWHPAWMAAVARHRAELRGSVFKLVKTGKEEYRAFVYATQSPIMGCFSVVRRLETIVPALSVAAWGTDASDTWSHTFAIDEPQFACTDDPALWECDCMLALTSCAAGPGGFFMHG